jgi:hypothetical protein
VKHVFRTVKDDSLGREERTGERRGDEWRGEGTRGEEKRGKEMRGEEKKGEQRGGEQRREEQLLSASSLTEPPVDSSASQRTATGHCAVAAAAGIWLFVV